MLWLALLAGSGCERPPPAPPTVPGPPVFGIDDGSALAWRARLPCADCDAIDTVLSLRREQDQPRYELVETFIDGERGQRFSEAGRWQREGVLLRLQADGGGQRIYGIEGDGRLSPRDGRGRRSERGDSRFLVPVTPDPTP